MEQDKGMKQMMDFYKAQFEQTFSAMTAWQEQGEKMMESFLEQASWMPAEGKKAAGEWLRMIRQGREALKNQAQQQYQQAESFFGCWGQTPGKTKTAK